MSLSSTPAVFSHICLLSVYCLHSLFWHQWLPDCFGLLSPHISSASLLQMILILPLFPQFFTTHILEAIILLPSSSSHTDKRNVNTWGKKCCYFKWYIWIMIWLKQSLIMVYSHLCNHLALCHKKKSAHISDTEVSCGYNVIKQNKSQNVYVFLWNLMFAYINFRDSFLPEN